MSISDLKPGSKIYLLGICGTAMASLAGLLKSLGYHVTGVDQNAYPPMSDQLEALGISYFRGYNAQNLILAKPDFVIVGNVISKSNPEVTTLFETGIPYTSLPNAMGELFLKKLTSLVVAGTHGKTTTTSALAWVLDCIGLSPGFLIGGIPKNFECSFRLPKGDFFAIEGDEYDTAFFDKVPKFTHYFAKHAILTSIEFDHADIYNSLEEVKAAFSRLVSGLSPTSTLVYHGDDQNIQEVVASSLKSQRLSYGFGINNDVVVKIPKHTEANGKFCFELKFNKINQTERFETELFGSHNALNLAAVVTLTHLVLGLPLAKITEALSRFKGVKRRQELLGQPRGITVIEDFAHHPTAVSETLKALKICYPQKNIWAVFEPRSATSRRKVFQKDYVGAFSEATTVLIKEPFDQSKIAESERFSSEQLAFDLKATGKSALCFSNVDQIINVLSSQARPGDVIVIMSNGGFDGIYQKLLSQLEAPQSKIEAGFT